MAPRCRKVEDLSTKEYRRKGSHMHFRPEHWKYFHWFNCEGHGVIVKWLQSIKDPETCYLDKIEVLDSNYKRRGYGTEALWLSGAEMWEKGCRRFQGSSTVAAAGYWLKLGAEGNLSTTKPWKWP